MHVLTVFLQDRVEQRLVDQISHFLLKTLSEDRVQLRLVVLIIMVKTLSDDRVQQRLVDQISQLPLVFAQDRVQQRSVELFIMVKALSRDRVHQRFVVPILLTSAPGVSVSASWRASGVDGVRSRSWLHLRALVYTSSIWMHFVRCLSCLRSTGIGISSYVLFDSRYSSCACLLSGVCVASGAQEIGIPTHSAWFVSGYSVTRQSTELFGSLAQRRHHACVCCARWWEARVGADTSMWARIAPSLSVVLVLMCYCRM